MSKGRNSIRPDAATPVSLFCENALRVLSARDLQRDADGQVIEAPEDLFWRVAHVVAAAEEGYGASTEAIAEIEQAFFDLMFERRFMPNSPTLMNAGRAMGMLSACFVLPVEDSIDGIFSSIRHAAMIQKAGGGTGFDFSRLRPAGSLVASSGGRSSGPVSFIGVFSRATDAIQQGAFRRGANMGILRIDHPDILEFIRVKDDLTKLTNFNLSVGVPDAFMEALRTDPDCPHEVRDPHLGEVFPLTDGDRPDDVVTARALFDLVVDRAWRTGEPGLVFLDAINRNNPVPALGAICATNPCGEQPLLPYESCNLGSVNLSALVHEGQLDEDAYRTTIRLAVRFLDNVVDVNELPLPELIAANRGNRKIGLGVMGFADALFALGIPYDSVQGLEFCRRVMSILEEESHAESERLAGERGTFPNWDGSVWDSVHQRPMRNATTTTVAPTGTISIIAGCSGGIEPVFSLAFIRHVLEGQTLTDVNPIFRQRAEELGLASSDLLDRLTATGSIRDFEEFPEDVRRVFVCARDIRPDWHVRMQAAAQEHIDSAVSKTVNFPEGATRKEVAAIFNNAWSQGVKGVTVYRDGSRKGQPMALAGSAEPAIPAPAPVPISTPEIMPCVRVRQRTPFGNLHAKISVDPAANRELEVFAQLGKAGDLASSDLEAICRLLSLFLRMGGTLDQAADQLRGIGSSLSVTTKEGRILSLGDGLARALDRYLDAKRQFGLKALLLGEADTSSVPASRHDHSADSDTRYRVKCPECDGELIFEEGCASCHSCGFSQC